MNDVTISIMSYKYSTYTLDKKMCVKVHVAHDPGAVFPTGGPGYLPGVALFRGGEGKASFCREDCPCIRSTADK